MKNTSPEPIAVIGIGCRFPEATGPEAFWQLLRDGIDATSRMPEDRLESDAFYDPALGVPRESYRLSGGFLDQVDTFDAAFFGISPREASSMDPQQRLLLEVAWEALEDAGQVLERIEGRGGVFIGMWINDYDDLLALDPQKLDLYAVTGGSRFSASGRLSYCFGFEGPSLLVDTACSSSLVAIHLACQSLRLGECDVALAGGANLLLQPQGTLSFGQANLLAADGRCKFGDQRADGFSRSEGVGVVVLKPLSRALAEGDGVYAVISGSAVNHNGRSSGQMVTPGTVTQQAVLRQACQMAAITPAELCYVEAHGTGTPVGDPIELKALGGVVTEGGRPPDRPCLVGSVKTNIGHTEGASGVAGVIKIALSLKHRQIPPSLFPEEPSPKVPWQELPVEIVRELRPWPDGPRRAGVNSFGLAGTNAHIIVEEAPAAEAAEAAEVPGEPGPYLLPLSAHSPQALVAQATNLSRLIADDDAPPLQKICYTAGARRSHQDHRLALVARDRAELAGQLEAYLGGETVPGVVSGFRSPDARQLKVAFVFPGQGSQWLGMGRELFAADPVFRRQLSLCDAAVSRFADFSLLSEMEATETTSQLGRIDVVQPALWAIQVSLAALWRSWGIEPAAVVGQSLGEVAAAYVAGTLPLEDAARVICSRSRLLRRTSGQGAMAMVELGFEEAQEALTGYEDRLSIAVASSFRSTVLSGDPTALAEVLALLESRDVFCRRVKVDVASHSPQMDPLCAELLAALEGLAPRAAEVPFYSTVEARALSGEELDATYWTRNLRQPVRFSTAVEQLAADDCSVFLEISPRPVLLPAIEQGLNHLGRAGTVLASLRRQEPERAALLTSLGALYCLGRTIDWERLHPSGGPGVRLPSYPWQRERFWFREAGDDGGRRSFAPRTGHPLLGPRRLSSLTAGTSFWDRELDPTRLPYLRDHRVRGRMVVPAAAYLEMTLAAAREAFGDGARGVEAVTFEEALFLAEDESIQVQLVISEDLVSGADFKVSSRQGSTDGGREGWTLHAGGKVRLAEPAAEEDPRDRLPLADIRARCAVAVSGERHYESLAGWSLAYGPAFRGVEELRRRPGEALGRLVRTEAVRAGQGSYRIHPALLDAALQVSLAALADENSPSARTYLPVALARLRLVREPTADEELWCHAALRGDGPGKAWIADVSLVDAGGLPILEAEGLELRRISSYESIDDWTYGIRWLDRPASPAEVAAGEPGTWILLGDGSELAEELARELQKCGQRPVVTVTGRGFRNHGEGRFTIDPERPEDLRRLLAAALEDSPPCQGFVHLSTQGGHQGTGAGVDELAHEALRSSLGAVHLVQAWMASGAAGTPKLWLVTRAAQRLDGESPEGLNLAASPLWGLGRVIAQEHPELAARRVDLGPSNEVDEARALLHELMTDEPEDEVAIRNGSRRVARLVRQSLAAEEQVPEAELKDFAKDPSATYQLEIPVPGVLDRLEMVSRPRLTPGPGEAEVAVRAAGLSFKDVVVALGKLSLGEAETQKGLGIELTGTVVAVGEGVDHLAPGDEVVGVGQGCFRGHVTLPAALLISKPAHLDGPSAATLPSVLLTAYYALHHLGRLRRGERILIHAAAGGVGMAAVQLAQRTGAEIFATAGNPEKRQALRRLGVEHVLDSRSLEFSRQVHEATGGRGVDVVLNSLAGEFLHASLSVLAPYGRFLELGKADVEQGSLLGLDRLAKNASFIVIDLADAIRNRPAWTGTLLREAFDLVEEGGVEPLPYRTYPVTAAVEAFRFMAQARHLGKIVLTFDEAEVAVRRRGPVLRADASYLVTGGLGALGLEVAGWMAEHGARHLVLLGRSAPSSAARRRIDALEKGGARVVVAQADVADRAELEEELSTQLAGSPPLRGVVHAAGLLADATVVRQNRELFEQVMAPKVRGAWNLHTATEEMDLDFFVLFSSVASLIGSPGQGNYSAANAFLDTLAHYRRARGLPAQSINWGAWSEIGLAARPDRGGRLGHRGLASFTPEEGVEAFGKALAAGVPQIAIASMDWPQWCRSYPSAGASTFLAEVRESGASADARDAAATPGAFEDRWKTAHSEEDRRQLLVEVLTEQVSQVLRIPTSRVDPAKPLGTLGLDSLMALELRNRLESGTGISLPTTAIWRYPGVMALADHLKDLVALPGPETTPPGEVSPEDHSALSAEDVETILAELDSGSESPFEERGRNP